MNSHCDSGSQFEAQAWLWQHKGLFVAFGVLLVVVLVALSGNGF
jgi:hypothetical protein